MKAASQTQCLLEPAPHSLINYPLDNLYLQDNVLPGQPSQLDYHPNVVATRMRAFHTMSEQSQDALTEQS